MEWQQPPPARRGKTASKWAIVAEALKANPNKWAMIGSVKHASQAAIIARNHGIKVITRQGENKKIDLYGIYEGESDVS